MLQKLIVEEKPVCMKCNGGLIKIRDIVYPPIDLMKCKDCGTEVAI